MGITEDVSRVATVAAASVAGAVTLTVELANTLEEGTVIQVGMGPNRELAQVITVSGENTDVLNLAVPLSQAHQSLEPLLIADTLSTRTTFPGPPATVRQATIEVAANILANAKARHETPLDTQKLDWIFNEEVREALDSFRC